MTTDLERFLAECTLLGQEEVDWNNGALPLYLTAYLSSALPPDEYVTSVRCLIF